MLYKTKLAPLMCVKMTLLEPSQVIPKQKYIPLSFKTVIYGQTQVLLLQNHTS